MDKKCLTTTLPFLSRLDKERRKQFEEYFETAPQWLLESMRVEETEKESIIFYEGDDVRSVCLIGEGMVKVTNCSLQGMSYSHRPFTKVYAYGGMEILMEVQEHSHTLETITPCTLVKIPKHTFEHWLQTDIAALKRESKLMGEYLFEQACSSRDFLFLQGSSRLACLFSDWYENYAENGILRIRLVRQELSDYTGICVRSVNRCIKKFTGDGYISRRGNVIEINRKQYLLLKERAGEVFKEAI